MDSRLLFELTYVLYRVCSAIIHGECWLMEPSRKFCLFYPPCKGWLRNLAQRLFHNVSSYSFARRAPMFPSVKMLFLTGEGLAWWSSRPLFVYSIFIIIGRDIRAGRGSLLLCSTELLLQVINLSLHDFIITLLIGYVTFPSKTTSPVWVVCTLPSWLFSRSLSRSRLRNLSCWRALADFAWCRLVWCGSDSAMLNRYTILKHKLFPQTVPIVGSQFVAPTQKIWDMSQIQ